MSELIHASGRPGQGLPVAGTPLLASPAVPRPSVATVAEDGWSGPRWLWRAIARRRVLAGGIMLLAVFPALVYVITARPSYRATASIQVDPESAKILPYQDVADSAGASTGHYELYIKTQDEILRSDLLRSRAEKRVREKVSDYPATVVSESLAGGVAVDRVPGSLMLRVSHVAQNPALAAAVANTWAEEFISLHRERRQETGQAASEFLRAKIDALEKKMRRAEADLVDYAHKHAILNLESGGANIVRQRFDYLNAELSRAEKDFMAVKAQYDGLQNAGTEVVPPEMKNSPIATLEAKVFDAERELTEMLGKFGEKWPGVAEKRRQVDVLKQQLSAARKSAVGGVQAQVHLKYAAARAEYEMLRQAVDQQAGIVARLNRDSLDYNSLKRDVETSHQLYNGLLQKLKETGVSAGTAFGNIHLAVAAAPPTEPFRPKRGLTMAMAFLLGLTLVVGVCGGLESFRTTLDDPWEVERFGVALLGWIPKVAAIGTEDAIRLPQLRPVMLLPDTGVKSRPLLGSANPLRRDERVTGLARECFRTLSASIALSQPGGPPQVLLVSSAVPQEGKSTMTASLGIAFAEMGWPTLLIDADLRRPTLAARFGIESGLGLSTYLAGGTLSLCQTETPNLVLLPAGAIPPNSLALLNSQRLSELLSDLSKQFRFIIVDGPPVLSVADANVLASKVSGVLLVVQAGKTGTVLIQRAVQSFRQTGANVLGVAVNQVDVNQPNSYSGSDYYYYYAKSGDRGSGARPRKAS